MHKFYNTMSGRTTQTVKQKHFLGYGASYYRAVIRQAIYFVDDVEFLANLSTLILEKLDKETRERILRELEFMTRKRDDIALEKVRWKLEELSKMISPIFRGLGIKKSEVSLASVVALLPIIDIVVHLHDNKTVEQLLRIEEVVVEIAELLGGWRIDKTSRLSYYEAMKNNLRDFKVKIDSSTEYTDDVKHVVHLIKKFFAVPRGRRYISYWAGIIATKIKRTGIEYIDNFDVMVKILDGEVYTTLLPMLMHYETRILYQLAKRGFGALFDLPERFKKEMIRWVNYWLKD